MQLPGPGAFGPPKDHDQAVAVLRRAVEAGDDGQTVVGPAETNHQRACATNVFVTVTYRRRYEHGSEERLATDRGARIPRCAHYFTQQPNHSLND
jgi:hypothetical protein